MNETFRRLARRWLPQDWLVNCQWYRQEQGGFWCHSKVMGWVQRPDWVAESDLALCRTHPEMYNHGRDIEDYREKLS